MSGARIGFWGVRGSCPAPGVNTARYGGHTACLTVESPAGDQVILDAGSGIFPLGRHLARQSDVNRTHTLLLTHPHWDHILGLPFFEPLYHPGDPVRILGPRPANGPLAGILERLFDPAVFPVPRARPLEVVEVEEGSLALDPWSVSAFRACHPGHALGFRLEAKGMASVAYFPDDELGGQTPPRPTWRGDMVHFLKGVHTLVHDAMFTAAELDSRRGWGHSAVEEAVALASEAGCRRLVLFHHAPERSDAEVDALLDLAREAARAAVPGGKLEVEAAMEGDSLPLVKEE